MQIRISNPKNEGVYQGSKWLKVPVLCDAEELRELFDDSFSIIPLTGIFDGKTLDPNRFLSVYSGWIEQIKEGRVPSDSDLRQILACVWAIDLESVWLQEIPGKGYLAKVNAPQVLVQAHYFSYSRVDGAFRTMSMGEGSVFWGIQFSYPQVYQDPQTMEIRNSGKNELFEKIRRWSRDKTRATPFQVDGVKTCVPIRLGKNCFSWIGQHPQLIQQGIQVV